MTVNRPYATLLTVLLAVTCSLILVADAGAGTYTTYTCKTPTGGRGLTGTQWPLDRKHPSVNSFGTDCPKGPFWLDMHSSKSHEADDYIHATFSAPEGTTIRDYTIWRSVQLAEEFNYRYYELTERGSNAFDVCEGDCRSLGKESDPLGASNRRSASSRNGVTGLMLSLTCGGDTGTCAAKSPGAELQIHRADITLDDPSAPVRTADPSGPLVQPGRRLSGVVPVSLSAKDSGGGVYQAVFEVDGRVVQSSTIDSWGGRCRTPFIYAQPCKLSASGTVGFDTASLPDGRHSLRILVTDATGTNAAAWGPIEIRTANASCNPFPQVNTLLMKASVGRRARAATTTRYGGRVGVRGRLTTPDGAPVAGAPVCVGVRTDRPGAAVRPLRELVTNAAGRVSVNLGRGPSRRVFLVHRVAGGAVTGSAMVRVRAPVRLRAPRRSFRNGELLALRGRVGGRARRGVVVELQARRGSGWQTFGTTRTRRRGRFSFGYRFTRTSGVQNYSLRARVPRQSIHPFAAGGSRPVVVRVIG